MYEVTRDDGDHTLMGEFKMIVMKTADLIDAQAQALSLGVNCLGIARLPRSQYALKVSMASYVSVSAKMSTYVTSTMQTSILPKFSFTISGFPLSYTPEDQRRHLQEWGWQVKILKSHSLASQGYRTSIALALSLSSPP